MKQRSMAAVDKLIKQSGVDNWKLKRMRNLARGCVQRVNTVCASCRLYGRSDV